MERLIEDFMENEILSAFERAFKTPPRKAEEGRIVIEEAGGYLAYHLTTVKKVYYGEGSEMDRIMGTDRLVITELRSKAPGGASAVLKKLTQRANQRNLTIGVQVCAESGDHARLCRLFERFSFVPHKAGRLIMRRGI